MAASVAGSGTSRRTHATTGPVGVAVEAVVAVAVAAGGDAVEAVVAVAVAVGRPGIGVRVACGVRVATWVWVAVAVGTGGKPP